jgi:hypothetical protein
VLLLFSFTHNHYCVSCVVVVVFVVVVVAVVVVVVVVVDSCCYIQMHKQIQTLTEKVLLFSLCSAAAEKNSKHHTF